VGCAFLLAILLQCVTASTVGYSHSNITSYNLMGKSNNSTLYNITLSNDPYEFPIYFIDLWGDRTTMGNDYGVLLGTQIVDCYNLFFSNLLKDAGVPRFLFPILEKAIGLFLDWQWDNWLSKQVTPELMQELDGIEQGGNSIGISGLKNYITRTITLANLPSDMDDLKFVFADEYAQWQKETGGEIDPSDSELLNMIQNAVAKAPPGLQCSMFGVWGSRTLGGDLYSARNLDWASNLGLDQYKCVQVWHPQDSYEHSAVGYSIMYGVLAGMNSKGISVHEANLESNQETFRGFPWVLRLRYIMENAKNIDEAWDLWENTNNTIGFNHMIASSTDVAKTNHAALAIETMAGYNAFFLDDDPREAGALYYDADLGKEVPVGFPLKEALWRTNHGYDPTIREHYMWRGTHAIRWSEERYMFAYQSFMYYQNQNIAIDHLAAINITSILGDKGDTAYQCQDSTAGSNIISVTFHPSGQEFWASWENGSGNDWRPAACNNYVHFDLSEWFSQTVQGN